MFLTRKAFIVLSIIIFWFTGSVLSQQTDTLQHIYVAGEAGYKCFRIPALIVAKNGAILAFAEARKLNCGDAGDIDLVVKRSEDGGKSWSPLALVWNDSNNTCGNPAPVVDQRNGKIILLSTWNLGTDHEPAIIAGQSTDTRRVFVISSNDEGISWSKPHEVTSDTKKPEWTWYATGPGNGIQIRKGSKKGRLVIPCDHIEAVSGKYYSHAIFSDDGGEHWQMGGSTPNHEVNECTVAELANGDLLLNMRNYGKTRERQIAVSNDGGLNWVNQHTDTGLIEPVCQASLISFDYRGKKSLLAFSNPASKEKRINMTVRLSFDQGKTWPKSKTVFAGPSAYSNLAYLANGKLACLFEAGKSNPYEGIAFSVISLNEF